MVDGLHLLQTYPQRVEFSLLSSLFAVLHLGLIRSHEHFLLPDFLLIPAFSLFVSRQVDGCCKVPSTLVWTNKGNLKLLLFLCLLEE